MQNCKGPGFFRAPRNRIDVFFRDLSFLNLTLVFYLIIFIDRVAQQLAVRLPPWEAPLRSLPYMATVFDARGSCRASIA